MDLINCSTRADSLWHLNQSPIEKNEWQKTNFADLASVPLRGVVTGRDRGEKYLKHKHMVQKKLNYKIFKASYDVHVNMTHISEPIRCISFRVTDGAEMLRFRLSAHCYLICLSPFFRRDHWNDA